jgi:putative tricarboxylic transport membrane protein
MPTRQDLIDSSGAIARGTILGSLLGIPAGGGAVVASFAAYTFEKAHLEERRSAFGRGAIRRCGGAGKRQQRGGADIIHSRCSRSAFRPMR